MEGHVTGGVRVERIEGSRQAARSGNAQRLNPDPANGCVPPLRPLLLSPNPSIGQFLKRPTPRNVTITFFLCLLLTSAGSAQVGGRWRITLENSAGSPIVGELLLNQKGGHLEGTLLLASRDSSRVPVLNGSVGETGEVRFEAAPGEAMHFDGHLTDAGLEGTATNANDRFRWSGIRLDESVEFYAALPRFRVRQLIVASGGAYRIPGRWLAAATALSSGNRLHRHYADLATRLGLAPLPAESLGNAGLIQVMGLFRRSDMHEIAVKTLQRIRAGLRSDTAIARFDYLFHPSGAWLVDIHDVALARARRPFPALTWESASPALRGAGLLRDVIPGTDSIPLSVYRLASLSHSDSAGFLAVQQQLREADSASAFAVAALIEGYDDAAEWYVAVMDFLLRQRWFAGTSGPISPADLVARIWRTASPLPAIRTRFFGYPEGTVRIGLDSEIVTKIVNPENATGREWLARHGTAALVETLHRIVLTQGDRTILELGERRYRLSSIGVLGTESFSGFLEPRDIILLDPSYEPLLALGTLVHEWQHVLHEHARMVNQSGGDFTSTPRQVVIHQIDPYLAEGLAEWLTEDALSPIAAEYPLVAFGEAEKRASLPESNPHNLGYFMVQALAAAVDDRTHVLQLLVEHGSDPSAILGDRRVVRAWAGKTGADRVISNHGEDSLIPEVIFTIEDEQPDVVESRIVTPQ
jgi:hypothetical protein